MPIYDYQCPSCGKSFSVRMSMTEHDMGAISCPECKNTKAVQQLSSLFVKTSKKS